MDGIFDMIGVQMRRDAAGTIHISDCRARAEGSYFESDPGAPTGVAFCFHDEDGRCPSEPDVPAATFANWIRYASGRDPETNPG